MGESAAICPLSRQPGAGVSRYDDFGRERIGHLAAVEEGNGIEGGALTNIELLFIIFNKW